MSEEKSQVAPEIPESAPKESKKPSRTMVTFVAFVLGFVLAAIFFSLNNANQKQTAVNEAVAEVTKGLKTCEANLASMKASSVPTPVATQSVDLQPVLAKIDEKCGPTNPTVVAQATTPKKKVAPRPTPKKYEHHVAPQQPAHASPDGRQASAGMPLLWHAPDATASNPKPCVISGGDGLGLPAYCAGFTVAAVRNGETKNVWLVRVGGGHRPTDTGLYNKENDPKGPMLPASPSRSFFNN